MAAALVGWAGVAGAEQAGQAGPGGGRPPGPPPEAVQACAGKSEGAQVSFSGRNGESFSGVCRSIDGQLAAMPAGMAPPGGRPPSQ